MSLFHRKSRLERAVDVALPLLEARLVAGGANGNGNGGAPKRRASAAPIKKGLAAVGGVAGVAAGSAAVSALRQRSESSKGDR
jgi:hypothetical protein